MIKKLLAWTLCLLMTAVYCQCGKRDNSQTAATDNATDVQSADVVQDLEEYDMNGQMEVNGTKYSYYFSFKNDSRLPVVTNHEGFRYHDNVVELAVYRGKSSDIVSEHRFTKESFRQFVPESEYARCVLAGFNYNYMDADRTDVFPFVATIGDADDTAGPSYIVGIRISPSGEVTMHAIADADFSNDRHDTNIDPDEDDA